MNDGAKVPGIRVRCLGMRTVPPLLVAAAVTVGPLTATAPVNAVTVSPDASSVSRVMAQQSSLASKKTGPKKSVKKNKTTKKQKKPTARRTQLRVSITGAPRGQVRVRGPRTLVSVTQSARLSLRSGKYRVQAAKVTVNGDHYTPHRRTWTVRVGKSSPKAVVVKYTHTGSSSPATMAVDPPPSGELGRVFALVNEARSRQQQCGTRTMSATTAVSYDAEIARAAQLHAEDMAAQQYFEHDSLDGRTFVDRINATAYEGSPAGENIAMGFQTADEVVQGWLASPGHCRNLMDPEFDEMGLGFASRHDPRFSEPSTYWVQDFGYSGA